MLVDGGSRVVSLVHEHRAGVFEAELFDQPTDYAPGALAIATAEQVLVFDERS